jgi:hypothetical protein
VEAYTLGSSCAKWYIGRFLQSSDLGAELALQMTPITDKDSSNEFIKFSPGCNTNSDNSGSTSNAGAAPLTGQHRHGY